MKWLVYLLIACTGIFTVSHAKSDPRILDELLQSQSISRIDSVEYEATGRYYQFGQAPAPGLPWPAFEVDKYLATLDYARAAVHAKYHRVQIQEPGRARPNSEQTQDQYAIGGMTWNLAPGPVAMPANLTERNAELWASPHGFLKAAQANQAKVEVNKDGTTSISFVMQGKYRFQGLVNREREVVWVRSFMDSAVLGDTPIEFRYLEYRDFDGVNFPTRIERRVADLLWYELTVSALRVNSAQAFAVPPEIAANPVPSVARIEVTELAPGLLVFGGGSHNSVIVRQARGVIVIEAPLSEERSAAVIAKVGELFPGSPIIGVVNTHTHFDHAAGLRAYVARGVPVITQTRNARYYARAWAAPRTLSADPSAKSRRKAVFHDFEGQLLLADDQHPLEVRAIEGSGHNDAFAMVYLPKDRVLVEADAWTPTAPGAALPAVVNPLWTNLDDNIRRQNLDVERIAPLHGSVQTLAGLRAAIAATARNP